MHRASPMCSRDQLSAKRIFEFFPDPVSWANQDRGGYTFQGAYLMTQGWTASDDRDLAAAFPVEPSCSDQLLRDNPNLTERACRHCPAVPQALSAATVFQQAIQLAEDRESWTLCGRLFDLAINWSPRQARASEKVRFAVAISNELGICSGPAA